MSKSFSIKSPLKDAKSRKHLNLVHILGENEIQASAK